MVATAAVVAASTTALAVSFKAWDDRQTATNLGESLLPVYHATDNYVRMNWNELQKAAPVVSGFPTPHAPTVAQLQAAGYFTTPYVQGRNALGANAIIQLVRSPAGCAPVNCDVTYTVYYDRPARTATGYADIRTAATAAQAMEGVGGFSTVATPGAFSNPDGTWSGVTNPLGQAGVIAAYGTLNSSGNAAYVRVGDNRNPNLQGPLTVAGNISTAGSMTANETYTNGWFRSKTPSTGWYSEAHGVGVYATDSSWLRSYQDKGIYTGGQVQAGSVQSNGSLTVVGQITNYARNVNYSNDWSFLGYDAWGGGNAAPTSAAGSAYLNDAYFRSIGKWASQMKGVSGSIRVDGNNACGYGQSYAYCPAGYVLTGGGYVITAYGSPHNSPDWSQQIGNAWVVQSTRDSCFVATATCVY